MTNQISMKGSMKRKTLRIERFLADMDRMIRWDALLSAFSPHYKDGRGGRPAHALSLMLWIHFLQLRYNLSDPGTEEAIYNRLNF